MSAATIAADEAAIIRSLWGKLGNPGAAATALRTRAKSYEHDAHILADSVDLDEGALAKAVAKGVALYLAIADELRKIADQIDATDG